MIKLTCFFDKNNFIWRASLELANIHEQFKKKVWHWQIKEARQLWKKNQF